jgi:two-component system, cell cycle response regulator DivK
MPDSERDDTLTELRPGAGRTVLLVEDNLHNRRIFAGILIHYGYAVKEAVNGAEAVEMAGQEKPDLILMDLSLPVMDGWEATRRIKSVPELRHIPIIALTAHAMAGDDKRALQAGCDAYLSKPISPKKVVAAVQKMLERPVSREGGEPK